MDDPTIVRSVARPADGHCGTLKEARTVAKYQKSAIVLFDPSRGYLVAQENKPGYDIITQKLPSGHWTQRNDRLPNKVWR